MRRVLGASLLCAALACTVPAQGDDRRAATLDAALDAARGQAGINASRLAPDADALRQSPTHADRLPLVQAVMAQPLQAHRLLAPWEAEMRAHRHDAGALARVASRLWGVHPTPLGPGPDESRLQAAADPLAQAFALLAQRAGGAHWHETLVLPDETALPPRMRLALARMLAAISRAEAARRLALAALPPDLTPDLLVTQAIEGGTAASAAPAWHALLPALDRATLAAGFVDLVDAVQALDDELQRLHPLPPVAWTLATPLGAIVLDTTGAANHHDIVDPMLVVDVGGDDHYRFRRTNPQGRVAVLLDRGGHDRYQGLDDAACPSAGVLGYGVLWDSEGDDLHEGRWLAQGAALFGASLLWDGGGDDRYDARGLAQAQAFGGLALLVEQGGDDHYRARTHAQASAAAQGVALLLDAAGDDHYRLEAQPLTWASPQLPDRNVSMGQGAARGLRPRGAQDRGAAGGIGWLIDLDGDDHYHAQVFAQGAGYHEALGVLTDGGGHDVHEAAWYGMGAAAHAAAGVLVARGHGHDRYQASHVTSIGAAHDLSVAVFIDEGGDDRYALADLGLGAAHDHGVALFADLGGANHYAVPPGPCRVYGASARGDDAPARAGAVNRGIFLSPGGKDRHAGCAAPGAAGTQHLARPHGLVSPTP